MIPRLGGSLAHQAIVAAERKAIQPVRLRSGLRPSDFTTPSAERKGFHCAAEAARRGLMQIAWADVHDLACAVAVRFARDFDCGGTAGWGARAELACGGGQMVLLLGGRSAAISCGIAADDEAGVYCGGHLSG